MKRRSFLKLASGLVAAVAVPMFIPAERLEFGVPKPIAVPDPRPQIEAWMTAFQKQVFEDLLMEGESVLVPDVHGWLYPPSYYAGEPFMRPTLRPAPLGLGYAKLMSELASTPDPTSRLMSRAFDGPPSSGHSPSVRDAYLELTLGQLKHIRPREK